MLFEQIPAYLEFFGWDAPTPELLRSLSRMGDTLRTQQPSGVELEEAAA